MTKRLLYFLILISWFACNNHRNENKNELNYSDSIKTKSTNNADLRFDFSAYNLRAYSDKGIVEIDATLYNCKTDTIYFLTSSCDGEQYSLQYDTAKFKPYPIAVCNESWPIIAKIAPKGFYKFKAHFRSKTKESKIKLGLDLYAVEKSFDLKSKNLNIFNRNEKEKNIIWAKEKIIG